MFGKNSYSLVFTLILGLIPVLGYPDQDCLRIVSNLERLACFDRSAGTPAHRATVQWSPPERDSPTRLRVMAHEATRSHEDLAFRLKRAEDGLMISAPAIASSPPHPYLVISCIQNISRLQLITAKPVDAGRVMVRLEGERASTASTAWQVTENGQVLDAGRGLPGIEQIKQLVKAHRIEVKSDNQAIDGLTFDAQGLDPLIAEARKACRW